LPILGGVVGVDGCAIGFNFTKPADKVKLDYRVVLPEGYQNAGSIVGVRLESLSERFALNEKGSATANGAIFKVIGAPKGPAPLNSGVKMTFSVGKKDLELFFTDSGLANKTTVKAGETIKLNVAVTLNANGKTTLYLGSVDVLYKATQGKTGKAAKAKVPKS